MGLNVRNKMEFKVFFAFLIILLLSVVPIVSAGVPVLFSEGYSYDPYVAGNYIVYLDYKDDPFGKDPESVALGIFRGRAVYEHHLPMGNIYLYNISANVTTPVYKSGCRSLSPWIKNSTIFWYEDKTAPVSFDYRDPNPLGYYLYSVPLERISFAAAENYSILNPDVKLSYQAKSNYSLRLKPKFNSDLIEIIPDGSDFLMYYTDLKTQNKTLVSSGHYLDYAYPQVYGDKVFWEDYRTGHSQLYVFSLENNREYQITPQYFSQYDCSVDGDIVAWTTYGGDLYYTNISGLIEKKLPVNSSDAASGPKESCLDILTLLFAISAAFLVLVVIRGRL